MKPHDQLVHEVYAFLISDVGVGGIQTMDDDPLGDPVPPYFYHYAIQHDDDLESSTTGYPGYASISYPGYTASIGVDAFLAYWAYTGDAAALQRARDFADWLIPRRTPSTDVYANWVYSTQTDGVMGGGYDEDSVMSDKPGMFGLRCLRLYDITGEAAYLTTAVEIADTYVATQLTGGVADAGRWPFRVRPSDGFVRQDYTSHLIPAIRLLEELEVRLPGNQYGTTAQAAWQWLENNPLNPASSDYMHWEGFYEDIAAAQAVGLWDHYSAENTLIGLLDRNVAGDLQSAVDIVNWSTNRYLSPDTVQNGWGTYHPTLLEWDAWPNTTYAATGQWAYAHLRLEEAARGTALHDPTWKTLAIEALHTMTYGQGTQPIPNDGRMLTTIRELSQPLFGLETWYEQNFNTVIYLLASFGVAPELVPDDEDHLLRFDGGELRTIQVSSSELFCEWSASGSALFKLSAPPVAVQIDGIWHPSSSSGDPGWSWDGTAQLLDVRHQGTSVRVVLNGPTATPSSTSLHLGPAAPNPSSGLSILHYRTPPGGGRLTIYDLRGRRVRRLALSTEVGTIEWDGRDGDGQLVPAGVYQVQLEARGERVHRKLVRGR